MNRMPNKRIELILTASSAGKTAVPTLDDLIAAFRKMTGRDPSEADIAKARAILDEHHARTTP